MNSNGFKRGDILQATHREEPKGVHFIIKYSSNTSDSFIGAMLSSTSYGGVNITMSRIHFLEKDNEGKIFKIIYKNSYIIPAKLIKPEIWGAFYKVGELSSRGIKFLEQIIGNLPAQSFEQYLEQNE